MGRALMLASLAALLAACGPSFELAPPSGFVTMRQSGGRFAQRSLTARGVVLAVRDVENDPLGPLEFWIDAIRSRLSGAGGYELTSEREVRAATGERGRQLRFGREEDREEYVYWVTVFPHGSRLVLVEAGGRRDRFEPLQAEIERAIAGARLR